MTMSTRKIAVAGATGRVGRHVVDVLEARATRSCRSSRSRGVDVITGEGLAEALAGVEAIVDAATGPSPERAGGDGVLHHRGPEPAGGRRAGRRAADGGGVDHRHRPLQRRLRRGEARARAGAAGGPDPGARPARGAVPRVRRAAHGVGHAGRRRATCRRCARSSSRRGPSPRRSPTSPPRPTPAPPGADPRRSPARARRASSRWRRCSWPGAATRCGSRASSDPSDPEPALYETGGLLPGPDAILAGPTFEEWLDEAA